MNDQPAVQSKSIDTDNWFWSAFVEHKWSYIQIIVAAGLINIFSLASSIFIMVVYDRVIPNNAVESLIALTTGMVIVIVFDFTLKFLRALFIDSVGRKIDLKVARRIFKRLEDLKLSAFKGSVGELVNSVREYESIRDFCTSATLATVVDIPFIMLFLLVIWAIGGSLVIVPILAIPLVVITGLLIQPWLAKYSQAGMSEGQSKQSTLIEVVSGLETMKALGAGRMFLNRWEKAVANHSEISLKSRLLSQITVNSASTAQQISQIGIVVYGFWLVVAGDLTFGALIASVILSGRCLAPLGQMANLMTRLNHARSAYRKLDALMRAPHEDMSERDVLRRKTLDGKIEFNNVSFRYPGQNTNVLENVSFTINSGEKVAILGRIGSGKSTVLRLASGLYEPDNGAVMIDNTDIRQIVPEDLRNNISMVLQDVFLFSGSVKENLTLGREDITDEDILRAAELSGVQEFIGAIPNGYDLKLRDRGEGLSGGQKQSISLARALVRPSPILFLDEPTSAMDNNFEAAVVSRLKQTMQDKTVVIVTHRASLLQLVDKIIIMDKGRIAMMGPRDQVLQKLAQNQGPNQMQKPVQSEGQDA
ncbi:type I secretion system permease/ATPase [Emcibacter nanhaiensis]|uniref:Type I secretion system permease/ATPase n=1 Tax=Emcibacter nanhaiensis TaxID=1505037 RepID=A0A501PU19_9PROT|nr:type I secretion system permease/ATPase [Emcibacter nanhaiensis]TPD63221.1 type I secretion system permease/ATPase [Emcibacter nanhaiensis]